MGIEIVVEPSTEAPGRLAGTVRATDGACFEFCGTLELLARIEQLVEAGTAPDPTPSPRRGSR